MRRRNLRILKVLLALSVAAFLWELAAFSGACSGRWPHIGPVLGSLFADIPALLLRSVSTIKSVSLSLTFGICLGFPLGVYLASERYRLSGLYEVVAATRPLPVTVLIPVFISAFGLDRFAVPLIAMPVVANVTVNVTTAVQSSGRGRRALLRSWDVPPAQYLRHVLLFEVMESIAATMRIMVPYALAVHIALDYFLQTSSGLGAYVAATYERYRFDQMFAGILVVLLIGFILTIGIDKFLIWCLRWKYDT